MKKILLATTMLVGTAGIAAAEAHITLSGDARMGVVSPFGDGDVYFESRARVMFTMTGTTDDGLEFGASFRANDAVEAEEGVAGSVFISGAFGKLSMGDVDGAALAAVGDLDGVGLTGLGDLNEMVYLSRSDTDESALYSYTTGNLAFYVSASQVGDDENGFLTANGGEEVVAVGAEYTADMFSVALGYEQLDAPGGVDISHLIVGGTATFSNVTLKAIFGTADMGAADADQMGVSATYAQDAFSATVFYNDDEDFGGGTAVGVGGAYDLGGGASVKAGYVSFDPVGPAGSDDSFDFGFAMEF
jgi:outer membrane protein OmpU